MVTRRDFLKTTAATAVQAAALAGVGPAFAQKKLDVVKGTFSPIVAYAPLYAAVDKGFFAKHGLDNQIQNVAITVSLPLVAKGDYDWGRSSNGPGYFNALNSGLAIVGTVDRLTYVCSADNMLVVSAKASEGGVRSFSDLKGKTVGLNGRGTATEYWHALLLKKYGMQKSDVREVLLGYPDLLAALSSGGADAGYMAEPLLTKGITEGKSKPIIPMHEVAPGDNIGMMFFGKKFIEKQGGDLATRWVMAWLEGARFAQDVKNRDEVIAIVARWTKAEPAILGKIYDGRITWPQVNPNGHVDVDRMLKGLGAFFLETKQIDKLPPAHEIYDPMFVNRALKEIGQVAFDKYQICKA